VGNSTQLDEVSSPNAARSELVGTGENLIETFEQDFVSEISEAQVAKLADDKVTPQEYQDAFADFHQCIRDQGHEFYQLTTDPNTGEYNYHTLMSSQTVVDNCYETHFKFVDMIYQSNPAITEKRQREFAQHWRNEIHPCLEENGITGSPVELQVDEIQIGSAEAAFHDQFLMLLQSGACSGIS